MTTAALMDDTVEFRAEELAQPLRVIACAARTDTGTRRRVNEDALLVAPPLLAVADGVGGRPAGEAASALALDVLRREVRPRAGEHELAAALRTANGAIRAAGHEISRTGMATTVVLALVGAGGIAVAHVGSRAYLVSDGRLTQLTVDHSLVSALVAVGGLSAADARRHPLSPVIVRALGLGGDVAPDIASHPARPGDLLLLCSDGLSDGLASAAIERSAAGTTDVDRLVTDLAAAARAGGSGDDITVIAARLG